MKNEQNFLVLAGNDLLEFKILTNGHYADYAVTVLTREATAVLTQEEDAAVSARDSGKLNTIEFSVSEYTYAGEKTLYEFNWMEDGQYVTGHTALYLIKLFVDGFNSDDTIIPEHIANNEIVSLVIDKMDEVSALLSFVVVEQKE